VGDHESSAAQDRGFPGTRRGEISGEKALTAERVARPAAGPAARPATRRFDTIDVLRGLSILAVVLLHTYLRMFLAGFNLMPLVPPWLFHLVNGGNGVTVFFAVSGFLITYTSIERFGSLAQMQPRRFYRIRFARIAPLLLAVLAILSALHLLHAEGFRINLKRETLPGALGAALTFTLNHYEAVHGYLPANWDVMWSLSIEEMFYLFFPLLCVLLLRRRRGLSLFVTLLLVFVVLGPFGRTIWAANDIAAEKSYLGGMSAIALGCLTALLAKGMQGRAVARGWLPGLQILGAVLMFWICLWPRWQWLRPAMRWLAHIDLDDVILAIGTCLVLFASVLRGCTGSRWTAPLRWFGRHSYEVYLTHEFVVVWGTALLGKTKRGPLALWALGMVLLTAPLGWLAAKYFSEPLNRRLRQS
jgi:peptidoglycan/LPS O-acetylase OafA/YrhL